MSNGSSVDQDSECRSETFSAASRTDSITSNESGSSIGVFTVLGRSNQPINSGIKRPPSEKIAKDTGCCLYSAITFIVVMVVTLGIVLIIAGPVLGLSLFPPLLRNQPPAALIDHGSSSQNLKQSASNATADYNEDHVEYSDYLYDESNNTETDYYYAEKLVMDLNATDFNETEDLSKLTPEAWRQHPKYVAYVPIPVNEDEEDEDGPLLDEIDRDHERSDEDDETRISSKGRVKEKVLLPIVMVPSGTSHTHEVAVSPDDVDDSWKSRDAGVETSRRYEEDESGETLLPSSSRRVPNRNNDERSRLDYQILSPRNRIRYRNRNRNDKKKLYSYLRAPARQNVNKRVEGLRFPPRYIRPPPVRPRNRNQEARFQSHPWSVREPERPRVIQQPTNTPKKPIYSYPRDAMSIQDIINYMTSLGSSTEAPPRANPVDSNYISPVNRVVWSPEPQQPSYRPRERPSIIPPSYIADPKQLQVNSNRGSPYTFKLDVFPVKENGREDSTSSTNRGVTATYPGFNPYLNHPIYRQNQEIRRPPTSSRQRPPETYGEIDYSHRIRYQEQQQQQPQRYRPEFGQSPRRPATSFRENSDDFTPPFNPRPRPAQPSRDQVTQDKPKVVVHLNVYNQRNQGENDYYGRYTNRNADEEDEEEEMADDEDYFYSPSDIYKAVLRNNAVRRNKNLKGVDDGPQSRSFDQNERKEATYTPDSTHQDNLYSNHNMAVTDHYYRSLNLNKNSSRNRSTGSNSRNSQDDDPEPLPLPMPLADHEINADPATEVPSSTIESTK